jgi:ABC-type glycerol-3-phosphate transport system substrate-binding protein
MKFQGNYELGVLSKVNKFKWDVVLMPRKLRQGGLGWLQSWVMGSRTKHPDEAWTLLHYLVTDGQRIMAKDPGRGLTPSLKKAAYSDVFLRKSPPTMRSWLDGWAKHFEFDFHPGWFEYQTAYSKALDAVFANTTSAQSAMKSATQEVNQILARYPWYSRSTR